jgi:DNA polymerase III subunit epsilon
MKPTPRTFLAAAALAALVLTVVAFWAAGLWAQLDPPERDSLLQILAGRRPYLFVLPFFLLAALGAAAVWLYQAYPGAVRAIASQVRAMAVANADHRLPATGEPELRDLADAINAFADRHRSLLAEMDERVDAARARSEEERGRLAALIEELSEGVVVCAADGTILLYNRRAKQLLQGTDDSSRGAAPVGLGRSIHRILSPGALEHALEALRRRSSAGDPNLLTRFVAALPGGELLRISLFPVLDPDVEPFSGYVLTLEDVTHRIETELARDVALKRLTEGMRGSLATLRAAAETLDSSAAITREEARRSRRIVRQEAEALSESLQAAVEELAALTGHAWILEEILAEDLLHALEPRLRRLGLDVRLAEIPTGSWLRVDGYRIAEIVSTIGLWLREELQVVEIELRLVPLGRFARLELAWTGRPLSPETMRAWQHRRIELGGAETTSLLHVLDRHGGEAWSESEPKTGTASVRFLLPAARPEPATAVRPPGSRPESYDFDLFDRPEQGADLDDRDLAGLTYTVFDTETTGLDATGGDRIVALGAVRVLNGRVLSGEAFDQLVDPQRPVPAEATAIHGLRDRDLAGQPTLARVLPRFHAFAEDSVLVAHNAAFDMRFLQLDEASAGVRFTQPILDTLLLSAVVHPAEADHTLEAIAERLGVPLEGRHTALGDAWVTAGILLKLIPLLREHGIRTLGEARTASRATMLARIRY